jgi:hypothetical protein
MLMKMKTPDIQDSPAETGRSGIWWFATQVSLIVLVAVHVLLVTEGGLAAIKSIVIWFFAAAPVCIVLATISFVKKEKHGLWSSIVMLPCLILLAWLVIRACFALVQ